MQGQRKSPRKKNCLVFKGDKKMHQYKVVEKKFVREGDVVLTTIGKSDKREL